MPVALKRLPIAFDLDQDDAPRRSPILLGPARRPAGTLAAVVAADHTAAPAPVLDDHNSSFPDIVKSEVDLVEELEAILRGEQPRQALPEALTHRPEPCRDEVTSIEAATALDNFLANDPWQDSEDGPTQQPASLEPGDGYWTERAAEPSSTGARANARSSRFWQVDKDATTATLIHDRRRRTRRTDVLVISGLVLLIAGGGAYSAMRDWSPDTVATGAGDALIATAATEAPDLSRAEAGLGLTAAATNPAAGAATIDPAAPAPRTVAVVPMAVDTIPATLPAGEVVALAAAPAPAPGERVETAPQPIDLLGQAAGPAATDPITTAAIDPAAAAATPATAAIVPPAGATLGTASTWVNLRAGADNDAGVLRVVNPGTQIVILSCDGWCQVVVEGTTGWIYEDFLAAAP